MKFTLSWRSEVNYQATFTSDNLKKRTIKPFAFVTKIVKRGFPLKFIEEEAYLSKSINSNWNGVNWPPCLLVRENAEILIFHT